MWWLLAGCWNIQEEARHRRVWEMIDHEHDLYAARDALTRGDLEGAQAAGGRMAEKDPLPGLPNEAGPVLRQLREQGEALEKAATRADAADRLVEMTATCAQCHHAMKIPSPDGSIAKRTTDLVWLGVAFEDERLWALGVNALGSPPDQLGWPERRGQLAAALVPH
ncbi:MAG: hypothetical protein H6738_03500 [Alphaproteobacteria bacterium]|nr:hypothetical protein [Alphaproteobacteria bacterium]MCB9695833.1 hypothetical protein [Alphaproteobacteria bacterium]